MTEHPSTSGHSPVATQTTDGLRAFRRAAIIAIIASLSITAVIGIVTLISGSFGEVQSKIMLTTLAIGAASVVALCDLAVLGRQVRVVGIVGLLASAVALVSALILIWGTDSSDGLVKSFALASIAAASIAHASLLLLLSERRSPAVRIGLWGTVALITLLLVLLYTAILSNGDAWSDGYAKLVGTVAILDVLGTIVVPVVSVFLKDNDPESAGALLHVTVPPRLVPRLTRAAGETGTTPQKFAIDAIERSLDARGSVESAASQ